jgi:hypothetical protein
MNIQCPNCNSFTSIRPEIFPELDEFVCSICGEKTCLKNGTERIVKLQFVLTESYQGSSENILPEETGESIHQDDELMQPSCSWQQEKVLYAEQHEGVQQE